MINEIYKGWKIKEVDSDSICFEKYHCRYMIIELGGDNPYSEMVTTYQAAKSIIDRYTK